MRISDPLVEKLLKIAGKVTDEQLDSLREQAAAEKKPLQDLVTTGDVMSEKDLTKLYAEEIDVPFIELNPTENPQGQNVEVQTLFQQARDNPFSE